MTGRHLDPISAHPVKSFFVQMLTRDIELHYAILDLLDNCVDGVQRNETKNILRRKKPYEGYWSKITFSRSEFRIEDNCGGIPWELRDYAFRLGSLKKDIDKGRRMIGTYGIGMKRAIFKLGRDCTIETHAKDGSYRIHISPEWMSDQENWALEAEEIAAEEQRGTSIRVSKLQDSVSHDLESDTFRANFYDAVATHYAYIIDKGFTVYLNDKRVEPKRIRLLFRQPGDAAASQHEVRPFIYKAEHKGVDIFLAVGFTRPIPSKEEADSAFEDYKERYSSAEAGWSVVCNDRTVIYCDKTALTGWGVSGVPQYHFQFIAISGIVIFSSDDARLLPMTTTKRGIDFQSEIYLHVREKMIEGMKIFTSYTNVWKGKELVKESKANFTKTSVVRVNQLEAMVPKLSMSTTRGVIKGTQYKPDLPRPTVVQTSARISFTRSLKDIRRVSKYLFDTPNSRPSEVGEECFRLVLEEASE